MSRRAAIVTQADVHRVVRGAKQAGARQVVVRPDGTMVILIDEDAGVISAPAHEVADERVIML